MLIHIDPSADRAIYLQIVDEVRRAITLGLAIEDEPLPSVRQLSGELRVNPNTVQQAYRELERDGLVYVQRGRGTFIARPSPDRDDRRVLGLGVAERALADAHRNSLTADELIERIREVAGRSHAEARDQEREQERDHE